MADVLLFAGPTLHRALAMRPELPLSGITVSPPIGRGDLPRATRGRAPGVVVLVDGLFHQRLAVGHAEIRDALAAGWRVIGLSSMGAIRAREMAHLGVRGFGRVFGLFCQPGVDFRDDEVTLLHEGDPPYREISEPLVHLRVATDDLVAAGLVEAAAGARVIDELAGLWFGERTMGLWRALLRQHAPGRQEEIDGRLADFDRYRVKSLDLIELLEAHKAGAPW